MKQTLFTFLLLSTIGLVSCRKTGNQPNIKQYDQSQIESYITANGITGMVRDTAGGDTTGTYYKIILQGDKTSTPLDYPDNIAFVFTLKSFDGKYTSSDTIENHYQGYLGHIINDALPLGLELAVRNDLKYVGASMRVLIPSHLAYGVNGYGTGSISNTAGRIAGNQCLDYYVHVISTFHDQPTLQTATAQQAAYDNQVILNYINYKGNNGEYTLDSGVYYRVTTPGTGTSLITDNSTLEFTFAGRLLNDVVVEGSVDSISRDINTLNPGVIYALKKHAVAGTTISIIFPSKLGFGMNAETGVPVNSPLRYEYTIQTVTP